MGRVNGHSATPIAADPEIAASGPPSGSQTPFNLGHGRALAQRLLHWTSNFEEPLQQALDSVHNTHTIDDVFGLLLAQRVILMTDADAFIIAEVITFPRAKHLHLWLGGSLPGRGQALRDLSIRMGELAKDMHCDRLTMSGREGWLRALEHEGWEPYHHTLTRAVQ